MKNMYTPEYIEQRMREIEACAQQQTEQPQSEQPKSSFWATVGWIVAAIIAGRMVGIVGVLIIAAVWWSASRIIRWYRASVRPPVAELAFMAQPALLIAMFAAVWVASDFLYAVAALVAVSLLYRPVAVCVFDALGCWYDRRTK